MQRLPRPLPLALLLTVSAGAALLGLSCSSGELPGGDEPTPAPEDPGPCPEGEVADCGGHCVPTSWLGDGNCDDGDFQYGGYSIVLDCEALDDDAGDCDPIDDGVPRDCISNGQCYDDELCVAGWCEPVFGTEFNVRILSASADALNSAGAAWDADGGPDMYAVVEIEGSRELTTATAPNVYTAAWPESTATVVLDETSFCVGIFDEEDGWAATPMDGTCWSGVEAIVAVVRAGGYAGDLYGELVAVEVELEPALFTPAR